MSFDVSHMSQFKPKVVNTFLAKGGGGGNTGYFRMEKGEEEKSKDSESDKVDIPSINDDFSIEVECDIIGSLKKAFANFLKRILKLIE